MPKTPKFGGGMSDEERALQALERRKQERQAERERVPRGEFEGEDFTHPIALVDPERYRGDEQYRRDWDSAMQQFSENAAYRILWERSSRAKRESDSSARASANAALQSHEDAAKVIPIGSELETMKVQLREIDTVLRITKWILGFVIAAVLGSVTVVVTKVFNWGMSTGEVEVRLQSLEREMRALTGEKGTSK